MRMYLKMKQLSQFYLPTGCRRVVFATDQDGVHLLELGMSSSTSATAKLGRVRPSRVEIVCAMNLTTKGH